MRKRSRTERVPVEQFGELLGGIDLRDHGRRLSEALRDATKRVKGNEEILLNLQIEGRRLADFTIEFLENTGPEHGIPAQRAAAKPWQQAMWRSDEVNREIRETATREIEQADITGTLGQGGR